jgi:hypothetical protein
MRLFCVCAILCGQIYGRSHDTHAHGNQTVLQMEITTFSLGHPVLQILDCAIYFFGGSLKIAFMYHHCPRPFMTHALQAITADMLHRVWDEFDYRVDVCLVTKGAYIGGF